MDISDKTLIRTIVVMLLVMTMLFLLGHLNGDSLDPTDREIRIVVTDSMDGDPQPYPVGSIPTDSLVIVKYLSQGEISSLEIGDVIQFRYGNVLDHHRIVSIDTAGKTVTTKGDNARGTETVKFSDITGKVVGVSHVLGMIAKIAKDYFLLIVILIGVFYTAYLLVKEYLKERRKNGDTGFPGREYNKRRLRNEF